MTYDHQTDMWSSIHLAHAYHSACRQVADDLGVPLVEASRRVIRCAWATNRPLMMRTFRALHLVDQIPYN